MKLDTLLGVGVQIRESSEASEGNAVHRAELPGRWVITAVNGLNTLQ